MTISAGVLSQRSYKSSPNIRFHDAHRDNVTFIPNLGSLLLHYATISRLIWRRTGWKDDHLLFYLCGLLKEALSSSILYCPMCAESENEREICGKKLSWPSVRCSSSICLDGLITNHESTSDRKVAVPAKARTG